MDPLIVFGGYALAAFLHLLLAPAALAFARPRKLGAWLAAACVVQALWALVLALGVTTLRPSATVSLAFELARAGAWFALLIALPDAGDRTGQADEQRARFAGVRRIAMLGAAAVCAASAVADFTGSPDSLRMGARIIVAIYGLLLLEQLWRNISHAQRWAFKFLCIALVALFGFDVALFSDTMLGGRLDLANWAARGYANAVVAVLLAVAVVRSRHWGRGLTVSREVVLHTATLLFAGVYLLGMASLGWWSGTLGGGWGGLAQTLALFLGAVSLAALALSGKFRAWLRVTLAKNFLSHRYDYRREWLEFTERLSRAADNGDADLAQRVVEELARLVECRQGALWLQGVPGADYELAVQWGAGFPGPQAAFPADDSLPRFLHRRDWVVSVPEWRADRARHDDLVLPDWCVQDDRIWLIVPLSLHGELAGFAMLGSPHALLPLNWEVTDLLKTVGRQAASYLRLRQALGALVQARQFDSFNRMSAFVVHDLKNLVAQLSLLLGNAARHRDNPDFQADMLSTVENVMTRMQALLLQLRVGAKPIDAPVPLRLDEVLHAARDAKRALQPVPVLEVPDDEPLVVRAHRDRLERVIGHLLQNASEATPAGGRIVARLRREDGCALVEVRDNGCGMSREFLRERLFRPFESTKAHGMGIGTFESREYVRELGGRLEVDSVEGEGTTFTIRLPLADAAALQDTAAGSLIAA